MTGSLTTFLQMGGHGSYVWSAYGITLLVLVISGWSAARRHRQALRRAQRSEPAPLSARRPTVTEL